jgi:inorganic phosphate transporter, PiT family
VDDILLTFGIALTLFLTFMSGFRDGSNLIATNVLSRSVTPQQAFPVAIAGELLGPFILGSAVAVTLGRGLVDVSSLDGQAGLLCLCTSVASATTWSLLTWWAGAPAGATQSLMGALLGGFVAAFGLSGVNWSMGPAKILFALLIVPIAGFVFSALATGLPKMSSLRGDGGSRKGQGLTLFVLSLGHGTNNAQRASALITMMLIASGYLRSFEVPFWPVFCAAVALTLGLSLGAWRMVKIFSKKTFRITPLQSLISQGSAGAVVLAANLLGCPVSTNQIVKASLVGASPAKRQREPGWIVVKDILIAWLINFPAAAVMAAALYWIAAGALGHGMGSFERIMEFMGQ